jgi:RHS repeat-associated protein
LAPQFTGKERDSETGLDYFEARYFSSAQGRFTSPDPLDWLASQNGNEADRRQFQAYIGDPQNLNLYAYVRNNPLRFTDPHGLYYCTGTTDQCAAFEAGLARAREALKSDTLTANQKSAITGVLGFLGKAQKSNGVVVSFGAVMKGAGGQTGAEKAPDGSLVVTITLPATFVSKSEDRRAEVGIHEGQHGMDDKASGRDPLTFSEFLTTETNAYTVQSYVMMGVGGRSGNCVWDPTWGADADKNRRDAIKKVSLETARKDCANNGGCAK